uniref:Uncharacterized protein n=1 Tax=Rhipicephalus zambeziensis TaxID=60191 RepID=A0A224YJB1_9ACAR
MFVFCVLFTASRMTQLGEQQAVTDRTLFTMCLHAYGPLGLPCPAASVSCLRPPEIQTKHTATSQEDGGLMRRDVVERGMSREPFDEEYSLRRSSKCFRCCSLRHEDCKHCCQSVGSSDVPRSTNSRCVGV